MTVAECKLETIAHIERVRKYIRQVTDALTTRAIQHDHTKLESPEVDLFTEWTPKLAETTYGSDEYNEALKGLKPALAHHYAKYRHHPEHFENGIQDMNLLDLVEMLCDWKASSERQLDGNLLKSIDQNQKRFKYGDELKQIFLNTAQLFER